MSDLRFNHSDTEDDTLQVRAGMLGAVVGAHCGATGEEVEVAIRYEFLPALIAALQDILAESDHGAAK